MERQDLSGRACLPRGGAPLGAKRSLVPKVLLLQFDTDLACAERRSILERSGMTIVEAEPRWPTFFDVVTAERPDVIVIAASKIPSHAFEAARYLGEGFNTRNIPVLLVDVSPRDRTRAEKSAPQATIVERAALVDAVKEALQPNAPTKT
jgi:PleD family two-component response regulator